MLTENTLRMEGDYLMGIGSVFCRDFHSYIRDDDYPSVLRVYNQKSMLSQSNVGSLTGCGDHRAYIAAILNILKSPSPAADRIRRALRAQFN